jgi:hypothetical protein
MKPFHGRPAFMRHLILILLAVVVSGAASAQFRVHLKSNVDKQPVWGPVGYDHVEFYYLPDIDVYYDVPHQKFFYFERGRWASGRSLPYRYRGFDLYSSYKAVVNEPSPYRNHAVFQSRYASFRGRHDQQPIRDSHDARYFGNARHPEHGNWVKQQQREHGNGNFTASVTPSSVGNGNVNSNGNGNGNGKNRGNAHGPK